MSSISSPSVERHPKSHSTFVFEATSSGLTDLNLTNDMQVNSSAEKSNEANHMIFTNHMSLTNKVLGAPIVSRHRAESGHDEEIVHKKQGLLNVRAFTFLIIWYIFSGFTLFLNKHILGALAGEPTLLATMQLVMTTTLGFIQMYLPLGMYKPVFRTGKPPQFWFNMMLLGSMRFITVLLGLISLKFVAVSFTETVKSSAPLFTVGISRFLIGEETGLWTFLSLIPIMLGLALCSAYELSFNLSGFIAALSTNLVECCQNVYSKLLISGEKLRYTPAELQFYTSIASITVQIPACYLLLDFPFARKTLDMTMLSFLLMNGVFFHFQSMTAYVLMDYISPVTFSVSNTVKRAFLIWFSVIIFNNPVTLLSGLGTLTVTVGVFLYTMARTYDLRQTEVRAQYIRQGSNETKIV